MLLYVQVGTGDHTQLHASLYGHEKTKVANGKVLKAFQAAESFPYIAGTIPVAPCVLGRAQGVPEG